MNNKKNIFLAYSVAESKEYKNEIETILKAKGYKIDHIDEKNRSVTTSEKAWKELFEKVSIAEITIVIHSLDLAENDNKGKKWGFDFLKESGWVYKEIRASLENKDHHSINGIIYVIPDNLLNDEHSIKGEVPNIIWENRDNELDGDDNFVEYVKYSDFINDPDSHLQLAYDKREAQMKNQIYKIVSKI